MPNDNEALFASIARFAYAVRRDVILMLNRAGSGHLGGSLSAADVLSVLYRGGILNVSPEDPQAPSRDRFILSNGHIAPVLYAALAHMQFFPREELFTLRRLGSRLQGHPSLLHGLPGLDTSSGSLGQGLSVGVGFALAGRMQSLGYHTFVMLGDGELQEGQVWEAAMSASHHGLGHLTAIVDYNGLQIGGTIESVMNPEPLAAKFKSFGWRVKEVDGHSIEALHPVLHRVKARAKQGVPTVILAKTTMGKGIAPIENAHGWHGKVPNDAEREQFLKELAGAYPVEAQSSIK